jgi:hypothetical protein
VLTIFGEDDKAMESDEAPTRFSDQTLDLHLSALWRAIIRQKRGRTVEPIIESLIEAAGGDSTPLELPPQPELDEDEVDNLPF